MGFLLLILSFLRNEKKKRNETPDDRRPTPPPVDSQSIVRFTNAQQMVPTLTHMSLQQTPYLPGGGYHNGGYWIKKAPPRRQHVLRRNSLPKMKRCLHLCLSVVSGLIGQQCVSGSRRNNVWWLQERRGIIACVSSGAL